MRLRIDVVEKRQANPRQSQYYRHNSEMQHNIGVTMSSVVGQDLTIHNESGSVTVRILRADMFPTDKYTTLHFLGRVSSFVHPDAVFEIELGGKTCAVEFDRIFMQGDGTGTVIFTVKQSAEEFRFR